MFRSIFTFFAISAIVLIYTLIPCFAETTSVPPLMNYQGRLSNPDGTAVADGSYKIKFSIYNQATEGTEKWYQVMEPVIVKNGVFAVLLGNGNPLSATIFEGNSYLEIKVGEDALLLPRQPIVSVGYAFKADSAKEADHAVTADNSTDADNSTNALHANTADNALISETVEDGAIDNTKLALDQNSLAKVSSNAIISSNGNIGIGTLSPSNKLTISGGRIQLDTGSDILFGSVGQGTQLWDDTNRTLLRTKNDEFQVVNQANNAYIATFNLSHAWFAGDCSATNFISRSSARFKDNIQPITNPLKTINLLQGVSYKWKQEYGGAQDIGFIAEDVAKVLPGLVSWENDGMNATGMNYGHLTALLVEGMKAQQVQIDVLKQQIQDLKSEIVTNKKGDHSK